MHLFVDYIQPLTTWLYDNPSWAFFITFLVSFAESLAIIGSIVPGSLTMTAIGILAGSGVMRIDLTLFFAALGAIAGDSASYALGYFFSDRLHKIWPFTRYPKIIQYGQDFFTKHGGKSVLIGRFVGPLRSIIPVIAGMMRMSQLQFLFANFLSALGWALLYVMPGYLIGAASHQLSGDSAKRLLLFMLALFLCIGLGGRVFQWMAHFVSQWYAKYIQKLYFWSKNHTYLRLFFRDLRDDHAENQTTIALLFLWIVCSVLFLLMLMSRFNPMWIDGLNQPTLLFLYSVKNHLFDVFFIIIALITGPINLGILMLALMVMAIGLRDWRLVRFLLSLLFFTVMLTWGLRFVAVPAVPELHVPTMFLDQRLFWTVSTLTFVLFYFHELLRKEIFNFLRPTLLLLLALTGFSNIYLGDSSLSSVMVAYFLGFSVPLIHWIVFQRKSNPTMLPHRWLCFVVLVIVFSTAFQYHRFFQSIYQRHLPQHKQYALSETAWWYQEKPLLPLYTTNRIGKQIGVFNLQYVGSLQHLEHQLVRSGWQRQSSTWLYSLLLRVNGQHVMGSLPFMEQLYLNKRPTLIMTYHVKTNDHLFLLRLWPSNYYLTHVHDPIWLGSVIQIKKKNHTTTDQSHLLAVMQPALKHYRVRSVVLKDSELDRFRYTLPAELLIILENTISVDYATNSMY